MLCVTSHMQHLTSPVSPLTSKNKENIFVVITRLGVAGGSFPQIWTKGHEENFK